MEGVNRNVQTAAMLTFLFAAVAIWWAAPRVASQNYRDLLVAALLGQAVWIFIRWRASVYAFMIYIIVEGFLINYFTGYTELNLVKDVFVVLLFTVMASVLIVKGVMPIPAMSWLVPFGAFAAIYLAEVFNPALPNIFVGLVGVRVTLLYFLLVPVAYWFFDSRERVLKFFVFMEVVSIPVSLFGIVQYFKGPEWMEAMSPGFNRAVFYAYGLEPTKETMYFRTFSTFVHTGGFSQYLLLLMLVTLALWAVPAMRRHRAWIVSAFVVQFLAQLTTGGRSSFIYFVVGSVMFYFLQRGSLRVAPLLVLAPLLFMGTIGVVGPGFVERYSSVLNVEYVRNRNLPLLTGWLTESMKTSWAGLGAGYACVASRHVGVTALNVGVVENGLAKMRFEAGWPGLILYVIFILSMMLYCLRQTLQVRDVQTRWFSSACATFLIINLATVVLGTPFDASPTNVYIWFFAGFLARAPLLDKRGTPAQQGMRG
jgi:hypothetical protein